MNELLEIVVGAFFGGLVVGLVGGYFVTYWLIFHDYLRDGHKGSGS